MLPTNLLGMVRDPYLEDRQLAVPKEIVDIVESIGVMAASINLFNPSKEAFLHA
jgi:hypothetical protein